MSLSKEHCIYTVGHSTRSIDDFIAILKSVEIEMLIDVRRFPGSKKFPQFHQDALIKSLKQNTIDYHYMEELGGRRKMNPDSKNTVWRNASFRAYADYMETEEFKKALADLKAIAVSQKTAIMCAEAVWWRCHRSMISDALKAETWEVLHLMERDKITEHPYTQPAKIENGKLIYKA
ncbi:MAG: DUF488 domain-containing protein [Psychroflexus sp.]|nr:DUF488 domain-containing protein [Psychroflexus sp.]MDN6310154.1 DUF488 domain-containing protein [Psychroflexus sp.]